MSAAPVVTIFVRHTPGCKWAGEEFAKSCKCRKHFRWSQGGEQHRRKAGTRSWAEAEEQKRRLEDQLAGRTPEPQVNAGQEMTLRKVIEAFDASKEAQGVKPAVRAAYALQLSRLLNFCEGRGLYTPTAALTLENLLAYRATWTTYHKSSYSRHVVQAYLKHFLGFTFNAGWIPRVPKLSPIRVAQPETEPLTDAEYEKILDAVYATVGDEHTRARYLAILQLMRWSGLAVRDAATLKRSDIVQDGKMYKIVRARTKTGSPLYIPIPSNVGERVIAILNGNPVYVFWDKRKLDSSEASFTGHWSDRIANVFEAAGIVTEGHMISHRLRATFAVDLLQKGVPLEHVSKLLGHKNVATTEKHYAKWVKGRQQLLDNIVSASWSEKS